MKPHQIALTRRLALVLGLAAAAPRTAHAATFRARGLGAKDLHATLAAILPPGLDPARLGAELYAAAPIPLADCLHRAGLCGPLPSRATLTAQIANDFAAGRVVTIAGWHLSRTEAWLCAAIHAQAQPPRSAAASPPI